MACPGCLEGCAIDHFVKVAQQPISTETTVDGVFTKTFVLPQEGLLVPQHAHATDHMTAVVSGGIRVWSNGRLLGDVMAPHGIVIPAGDLHHFMTIRPDTTLMCIHDVSQGRSVKIVANNALPGSD